MAEWTIWKVEKYDDGSLKSVRFNPVLAVAWLFTLAILIGLAARLWAWAL